MLNVAVLFGGRSGEHEVSKCSAASVYSHLDRAKYKVTAVGIDRDGRWYPQIPANIIDDKSFGHVLDFKKEGRWYVQNYFNSGKFEMFNAENGETLTFDVIFPVVHGTFCEDGTLQGLLELASVPYVGSEVIGSSVGMDKEASKRLMKECGVPVVPWITIRKHDWLGNGDFIVEEIKMELGLPCFVKPANSGSSVGIYKIKNVDEIKSLIEKAFRYDTKVLIEKAVDCREIECAVMGNNEPQASVLGEIIPSHEFYSYEAKYIDANGASLVIPAKLPETLMNEIRNSAVCAYSNLYLKGMARVDFFVDKKSGAYYLNEVNTIPGFTAISMYPKLWAETGVPYDKLLDHLIDLALSRYTEKMSILTQYYD